MRHLACGLVIVTAAVALGPVLNAQEPAAFVAVRDCQINRGEFTEFVAARRALREYLTANPVEAPGRVSFFGGALNNNRLYQLVWFGENLGEWDEWDRTNREARATDPGRRALFFGMFSHLNSCNWTFTRRIVN
ncbi:MAG: hypothetical protein VX453_00090 [Acidobacteriota bacterium]|nr:hypothetical protein [Acidobacteriota bacterium]